MMRIVFVNLHGNEFLVKTLNKIIFKQSVAIKHKYFLDYLLSRPDIEVCSYINPVGFSLATHLNPFLMRLLYPLRFIEHKIVLKKNGISLDKITVLKKLAQLRPDDIVIMHHFAESQFYDAALMPCFKAVSMVHFSGDNKRAEMLKNSNISILFGECDLKKHSDIFNKYYSWYHNEMIVVPFVYAPRFRRIKPFSERDNRAFATGTITYRKDDFHINMYGDSCVQPLRKQIKTHSDELKPLLECTSGDYLEGAGKNGIFHFPQFMPNIINKLYIKTHTSQKKYYSFDMVNAFNNYKMSIVGEEIVGQPGIGFVEGMACGCAYIGLNKGYYEDYGMEDSKHFIGYDGTLSDLKNKILYYQRPENQAELEQIANNGYQFAINNFNGNFVAENLLCKLVSEQAKWLINGK